MDATVPGIHHITAIAGEPQRNLDFYTGVLGLRLVKLTVNFDDPSSYHLYYGDGTGSPGTILTFFPWPGARRGQPGTGQATSIAFAIPPGTLNYWSDRLREHGGPANTYGVSLHDEDNLLSFYDPDGLPLLLVEDFKTADRESWSQSPVPTFSGIRGFYGITLAEEDCNPTASLLTDQFGFHLVSDSGDRRRYEAPTEEVGRFVDLVCSPGVLHGRVAVGSIHHVAWRAANDDDQKAWRAKMDELGYGVTPVIDRKYFHSIYFREPGGVLFEIATDPPGFAIDERVEELGTHLKLPAWYENRRDAIERNLPRLHLPEVARGA